MALRSFMTAMLLLATLTYGDHKYGEFEATLEDITTSGDSGISTPANMDTRSDVSSQEGKAKFIGLNICGFDFGW